MKKTEIEITDSKVLDNIIDSILDFLNENVLKVCFIGYNLTRTHEKLGKINSEFNTSLFQQMNRSVKKNELLGIFKKEFYYLNSINRDIFYEYFKQENKLFQINYFIVSENNLIYDNIEFVSQELFQEIIKLNIVERIYTFDFHDDLYTLIDFTK